MGLRGPAVLRETPSCLLLLRVPCTVHLARSPRAELFENPVVRNAGSDHLFAGIRFLALRRLTVYPPFVSE